MGDILSIIQGMRNSQILKEDIVTFVCIVDFLLIPNAENGVLTRGTTRETEILSRSSFFVEFSPTLFLLNAVAILE